VLNRVEPWLETVLNRVEPWLETVLNRGSKRPRQRTRRLHVRPEAPRATAGKTALRGS
jgi:hypothetical protein